MCSDVYDDVIDFEVYKIIKKQENLNIVRTRHHVFSQ